MTDPLDALRVPDSPVDPDPRFARELRARLERALLAPEPARLGGGPDAPDGRPRNRAASRAGRSRVRPGEISYAALGTLDLTFAARFYPRVLGWTTVPGRALDGRPVRQVTNLATPLGIRAAGPALVLYYLVPDVDSAVELVRAAGGTAAEPTVAPYGRTVDCVDDQGLPFALVSRPEEGGPGFSPRPPAGRGELDYVLLRVPDSGRGRAFYGTVLGWRFAPGAGPAYWYAEPAGSADSPERPVVGLEGGYPEASAVPWFRVPDLAAALDDVRAAGGHSHGRVREQRGLRIECTDDQGAHFGLAQV